MRPDPPLTINFGLMHLFSPCSSVRLALPSPSALLPGETNRSSSDQTCLPTTPFYYSTTVLQTTVYYRQGSQSMLDVVLSFLESLMYFSIEKTPVTSSTDLPTSKCLPLLSALGSLESQPM